MRSLLNEVMGQWRTLRIAFFVTGAITLILFAILLLGATAFRFPLAAAVAHERSH
jgi:hypothetical protein